MEKMTFSEYMNTLPNERKQMIDTISKECKCSTASVYRWIRGESKPSILVQEKISEITHIPASHLFR